MEPISFAVAAIVLLALTLGAVAAGVNADSKNDAARMERRGVDEARRSLDAEIKKFREEKERDGGVARRLSPQEAWKIVEQLDLKKVEGRLRERMWRIPEEKLKKMLLEYRQHRYLALVGSDAVFPSGAVLEVWQLDTESVERSRQVCGRAFVAPTGAAVDTALTYGSYQDAIGMPWEVWWATFGDNCAEQRKGMVYDKIGHSFVKPDAVLDFTAT